MSLDTHTDMWAQNRHTHTHVQGDKYTLSTRSQPGVEDVGLGIRVTCMEDCGQNI